MELDGFDVFFQVSASYACCSCCLLLLLLFVDVVVVGVGQESANVCDRVEHDVLRN